MVVSTRSKRRAQASGSTTRAPAGPRAGGRRARTSSSNGFRSSAMRSAGRARCNGPRTIAWRTASVSSPASAGETASRGSMPGRDRPVPEVRAVEHDAAGRVEPPKVVERGRGARACRRRRTGCPASTRSEVRVAAVSTRSSDRRSVHGVCANSSTPAPRARSACPVPCACAVTGRSRLRGRVADRRELGVRKGRARLRVQRDLDRRGAALGEHRDAARLPPGRAPRGRSPGGAQPVAGRVPPRRCEHRPDRTDRAGRCTWAAPTRRRAGRSVGRPGEVADRGDAAAQDRRRVGEADVDVAVGHRRHHEAVDLDLCGGSGASAAGPAKVTSPRSTMTGRRRRAGPGRATRAVPG